MTREAMILEAKGKSATDGAPPTTGRPAHNRVKVPPYDFVKEYGELDVAC